MSGPADPRPYIRYFETLSRQSLSDLRGLAAADMRFVDPFNDVVGVERVIRVLDAMYDDLDVPRFVVMDHAMSGQVCYMRWRFTARTRKGGAAWQIDGMSEVRFDDEGRVSAHLDHWDASTQFYARLPLVGWLIGLVRRRLQVRY